MRYFLAPRSGEKSHENYKSTIKGGVDYQRIKSFLDSEAAAKLLAEEVIYAWGNREGTKAEWEKMENGDTVIFYAQGKLVMIGEVYYKKHDAQLALALWPPDENGKPWEYTFFLKNLRYIKISMPVLNALVGFKSNYIVQGFRELPLERCQRIIDTYGSVENYLALFSDEHSEEAPLSTEPVHVNVPTTIVPEVITDAVITPTGIRTPSTSTKKGSKKIDYEKRNRNNAITGSKGEVFVLDQERKRLRNLGRSDLAEKVVRVSIEDDTKGYDILSFETDGRIRYIEVKTTKGRKKAIHFYLSAYELAFSKTADNYYLYFVDSIESIPRITVLENPFVRKIFSLRTDTYIVEGNRN